jgi:hypothetical protein
MKLAMRFNFTDADGEEAESKAINLPIDLETGDFVRSPRSAFYPFLEALLGRPIDYTVEPIIFAVEGCDSFEDIPPMFEKGTRPGKVTSLRVGEIELLTGKRRVRLSVTEGEPFNGRKTTQHKYSADEFVPTKKPGAKPTPKPAIQQPEFAQTGEEMPIEE